MAMDVNKIKDKIDLNKVKEKLSDIGDKLENMRGYVSEKLDDNYVRRTMDKLSAGQEAIDYLQKTVEELDSQVKTTNNMKRSLSHLAKKERGEEYDESSITALAKAYHGNLTKRERIWRTVTFNKDVVSAKQGLDQLINTISKIPDFVDHLDSELNTREKGFRDLRSDLRNKQSELLEKKPEYSAEREHLEELLDTLVGEYQTLEEERQSYINNGQPAPRDLSDQLERMEPVIYEAKDSLREAKTQEENVEQNVKMISGQTAQVSEYLELVGKWRDTVSTAKNFANLDVPFQLEVLRTQKGGFQALAGIAKVVDILDNVRDTSGEINTKLLYANEIVSKRNNETIGRLTQAQDIYTNKVLGSGDKKAKLLLEGKTTVAKDE